MSWCVQVLVDDTARWVWELHGTDLLEALLGRADADDASSRRKDKTKSRRKRDGGSGSGSGAGAGAGRGPGSADGDVKRSTVDPAKYARFQRQELLQTLLFYGSTALFVWWITAADRSGAVAGAVYAGLGVLLLVEVEVVFGAGACVLGAGGAGAGADGSAVVPQCMQVLRQRHVQWGQLWRVLEGAAATCGRSGSSAVRVLGACLRHLCDTTVHEWVHVYMRGMLLPAFINGCRCLIPAAVVGGGEAGAGAGAIDCHHALVALQLRRIAAWETFRRRAEGALHGALGAGAGAGAGTGVGTDPAAGTGTGAGEPRQRSWWGWIWAIPWSRVVFGVMMLRAIGRWVLQMWGGST